MKNIKEKIAVSLSGIALAAATAFGGAVYDKMTKERKSEIKISEMAGIATVTEGNIKYIGATAPEVMEALTDGELPKFISVQSKGGEPRIAKLNEEGTDYKFIDDSTRVSLEVSGAPLVLKEESEPSGSEPSAPAGMSKEKIDSLFNVYMAKVDRIMTGADSAFKADNKEVLSKIDSLKNKADTLETTMEKVMNKNYGRTDYFKGIKTDPEHAKEVQFLYEGIGYDVDFSGDIRDTKSQAAVKSVTEKVNERQQKTALKNTHIYGKQGRDCLNVLVGEEVKKLRKDAKAKKKGEYSTARAANKSVRAEEMEKQAGDAIGKRYGEVAKRLLENMHDKVMGDVLNHDKSEVYQGFRDRIWGYLNTWDVADSETGKTGADAFADYIGSRPVEPVPQPEPEPAEEKKERKPIRFTKAGEHPGDAYGAGLADIKNSVDHFSIGVVGGTDEERVHPKTLNVNGVGNAGIAGVEVDAQMGAVTVKGKYAAENKEFEVSGRKVEDIAQESYEIGVGARGAKDLGDANVAGEFELGYGSNKREVEFAANPNVPIDDSYNQILVHAKGEIDYGAFKLALSYDRASDVSSDDNSSMAMAEPEIRVGDVRLKIKAGSENVNNQDKWNQDFSRKWLGAGIQYSPSLRGILKGLQGNLGADGAIDGKRTQEGLKENYKLHASILKQVNDKIAVRIYANAIGNSLDDGKRDVRENWQNSIGADMLFKLK